MGRRCHFCDRTRDLTPAVIRAGERFHTVYRCRDRDACLARERSGLGGVVVVR